jgi:hypothetical protein
MHFVLRLPAPEPPQLAPQKAHQALGPDAELVFQEAF